MPADSRLIESKHANYSSMDENKNGDALPFEEKYEAESKTVRQCVSHSIKLSMLMFLTVGGVLKMIQYKNQWLEDPHSPFVLREQYRKAQCPAAALKDMRVVAGEENFPANREAFKMEGYCAHDANGASLRATLTSLCYELLMEICDTVWDSRNDLTGTFGLQLLRFALLLTALLMIAGSVKYAMKAFHRESLLANQSKISAFHKNTPATPPSSPIGIIIR